MFWRSACFRTGIVIGVVLLGGAMALCSSCGSSSHESARPTAISAGGGQTCALLSNHRVECWGDNLAGQLGNGKTKNSSIPVPVSGITNATAISAGYWNTCALLSNHRIECWGANGDGELGNGSTTDSSTPVQVEGVGGTGTLSNATQVSAGGGQTCALRSSHRVECWGRNDYGELGNRMTKASSTPVQVSGISTATQVSAGGGKTCALLSSHRVECTSKRALVIGAGQRWTKPSSTPPPVQVGGISTAIQVSAGLNHTCALLSNHRVECWGYNEYGQLGNGRTKDSSTPVPVSGVTNATAISAGVGQTCALLSSHRVECWGLNLTGQLGNGKTKDSSTPVPVSGVTNATQVSAGDGHTCAGLSNGKFECWGANGYGSLGNGKTTNSSTPVSVVGLR